MSCKTSHAVLSEMFKLDNDDWHRRYRLPKRLTAASIATFQAA